MEHPVIFFDGICNLCNAAVQFILKHDQSDVFRLTALQGNAASILLAKYNISATETGSIVLLEDGRIYTKSTAALRIVRRLSGGWRLLYILIFVPSSIRDYIYGLVARNRYKLWGRRDTCMIPIPAWEQKFL